MKFKVFVAALALAMTQVVFAANYPKPDRCPTIVSLQDIGVSNTLLLKSGDSSALTGIERRNSFGTSVEWTLLVGVFYPDTPKNQVLGKANDLLTDLVTIEGPVQERGGLWVCGYKHLNDKEHSDKGFVAWAFYPSLDIPAPMLTRLLKK